MRILAYTNQIGSLWVQADVTVFFMEKPPEQIIREVLGNPQNYFRLKEELKWIYIEEGRDSGKYDIYISNYTFSKKVTITTINHQYSRLDFCKCKFSQDGINFLGVRSPNLCISINNKKSFNSLEINETLINTTNKDVPVFLSKVSLKRFDLTGKFKSCTIGKDCNIQILPFAKNSSFDKISLSGNISKILINTPIKNLFISNLTSISLTYRQIYPSDKEPPINITFEYSEMNIQTLLIEYGKVHKLEINSHTGGNIFFKKTQISNVLIKNNSFQKSILSIVDTKLGTINFTDVINEGEILFQNVRSIGRRGKSKSYSIPYHHGNIEFSDIDFNDFKCSLDHLNKIKGDIIFRNVIFDYDQIFTSDLKNSLSRANNIYAFLIDSREQQTKFEFLKRIKDLELKIQWNKLRTFDISIETIPQLVALLFNKVSNNHGTSLLIPFLWLVVSSLVFNLLIEFTLSKDHCFWCFGNPFLFIKEHIYNSVYYLNPTHKPIECIWGTPAIVIDTFSRITIGYLIFQFVSVFRKFSK